MSWIKWVIVLLAWGPLPSVGIAQGMIEETAEERIERLRSELAEAEAAAKAKAEVATEEAPAEEGITVDIPTGALVIVEGAEGGGGSGFIAKLRDRLFFVTNIHVLAGARGAEIRTADGQSLALPDYAFLSQKRDIAILPVVWTGEFLKVSASLSFDDVKIGDAITVMGNSDGVGVATRLHGDIDGIGPDQIEISAKFVPGNSGSPIIHNERATVIGVVSHMRDLSKKTKWTEDSEQPDIRRYGFRLDGEMAWERASLSQTRFVNNLRSELARDRDSTANDLKLSFFKSRFLELDRMRDFYDEQLKLVSF